MKKVLAALFVTAVAALVSMGFASTAQAGNYPCPEGTVANTPSATTTGTESDTPVVGCHSVTPPVRHPSRDDPSRRRPLPVRRPLPSPPR